jgi:hypothetical protein
MSTDLLPPDGTVPSDYPDDYSNLITRYAEARDKVWRRAKADLAAADHDFRAEYELTEKQMALVRWPFGDLVVEVKP